MKKIDQLRRKFGGKWRYDRKQGVWVSREFKVIPYSKLTPKYDGDDSTCTTIYMRSDTGKEIHFPITFLEDLPNICFEDFHP